MSEGGSLPKVLPIPLLANVTRMSDLNVRLPACNSNTYFILILKTLSVYQSPVYEFR